MSRILAASTMLFLSPTAKPAQDALLDASTTLAIAFTARRAAEVPKNSTALLEVLPAQQVSR